MNKDTRNTLLLCLVCAALTTLAFVRLVSAADSSKDPLHIAIEKSPRWHEDRDEPDEERNERLAGIVRAARVVAADATCDDGTRADCERTVRGGTQEMAVFLLTVAYWETRLSRRIQSGECLPSECDHGRARGLGQVQLASGIPRDLWEDAHGLDWQGTLVQMRAIGWVAERALKCGKIEKAFDFYALGACHRWHVQSESRKHWYLRVLREVNNE